MVVLGGLAVSYERGTFVLQTLRFGLGSEVCGVGFGVWSMELQASRVWGLFF